MVLMKNGRGTLVNARLDKGGTASPISSSEEEGESGVFGGGSFFSPPSRWRVVVASAVGEKAEGMARMLGELGCAAWVPLRLARSEGGESRFRADRFRRICAAAAEQSRSGHVMRVAPGMVGLERLLRSGARGRFGDLDTEFFCGAGRVRDVPPSRVVVERYEHLLCVRRETLLVVGPEGGFTEEEKEKLRVVLQPVRLSEHVLRVETAAVAGAAMTIASIANK